MIGRPVYLVQSHLDGGWSAGDKYPDQSSAVERMKQLAAANPRCLFRVGRFEVVAEMVNAPEGELFTLEAPKVEP